MSMPHTNVCLCVAHAASHFKHNQHKYTNDAERQDIYQDGVTQRAASKEQRGAVWVDEDLGHCIWKCVYCIVESFVFVMSIRNTFTEASRHTSLFHRVYRRATGLSRIHFIYAYIVLFAYYQGLHFTSAILHKLCASAHNHAHTLGDGIC